MAVPDARPDAVEAPEHIEFCHREAREAVDSDGHAEHDEIEPADPSRTACRRPVLSPAAFPEMFRDRTFQLGGERARSDPRGECLRHPEDVREVLRSHAGSDRGGPRHAVARGAKRIDAVVDAEMRPLGSLEQDALAALQRGVQPDRGVVHVRREPFAICHMFREQRLRVESLRAAVRLDEPLLDGHDRAEFGAQDVRVDQVAHADAEAPDLVLEGGTDPPQGRPGPHVALQFLLEAVQDLVVRHHDMRAVANAEVRDRMATGPRLVNLLQELRGFDHDAVPDHVHRPFPEDPGREQVERVQLAPDLDGVARVRPSLEPRNDVGFVGEKIDDLALALVPELGPHDYARGHRALREGITSRVTILS